MARVFSPDLAQHFQLVHPGLGCGIVEFNDDKTKARAAFYHFNNDGLLVIGKKTWVNLVNLPKGKGFKRATPGRTGNYQNHYLHDYLRADACV